MTLSHEKCVLLVNTKKSVYPAITIREATKKRRSATAIRHQGSPQAYLLNGSAPRQYMTKYTLPKE